MYSLSNMKVCDTVLLPVKSSEITEVKPMYYQNSNQYNFIVHTPK